MSAYMVDRTHIDVLVTAAVKGPQKTGRTVAPWNTWNQFSWFGPEGYRRLVAHRDLVSTDEDVSPDALGALLIAENVRSIHARYPDTADGGSMPGPCDEYWTRDYVWPGPTDPIYHVTNVEALAAVSHFEYQACESDDWRETDAHWFCQSLRARMIGTLPGYDEAPWGFTADQLARGIEGRRLAAEGAEAEKFAQLRAYTD